MRLLVLIAAILAAPGFARAGDLVVQVRTPQGRPVVNAVVTVAAPHSGPIRFDWPYRMAQHHMQFDPFVLIVPAGAEVSFPNLDTVRHQVYSFSPGNTFELRLYGRQEARSVRLNTPGIVAIGCNIHDSMVAFIAVVDTPYAARTDAAGNAVVRGVPAGSHAVQVWHPYMRAPRNRVSLRAAVPRTGQALASVSAQISTPPVRRHGY